MKKINKKTPLGIQKINGDSSSNNSDGMNAYLDAHLRNMANIELHQNNSNPEISNQNQLHPFQSQLENSDVTPLLKNDNNNFYVNFQNNNEIQHSVNSNQKDIDIDNNMEYIKEEINGFKVETEEYRIYRRMHLLNAINEWIDSDSRYGGQTKKRKVENDNWEYITNFDGGEFIDENQINIVHNNSSEQYWKKTIYLNCSIIIKL